MTIGSIFFIIIPFFNGFSDKYFFCYFSWFSGKLEKKFVLRNDINFTQLSAVFHLFTLSPPVEFLDAFKKHYFYRKLQKKYVFWEPSKNLRAGGREKRWKCNIARNRVKFMCYCPTSISGRVFLKIISSLVFQKIVKNNFFWKPLKNWVIIKKFHQWSFWVKISILIIFLIIFEL